MKGAEVVKGDFFDKNTIESAVSGAHGCFLVTDYFKSFNKDEEIRQVGLKTFLMSYVYN